MNRSEHSVFQLKRVTALIGPYGSGKSELSLALALQGVRSLGDQASGRIFLCDMDVLKPYFRSRELGMKMTEEGVQVVAPAGALANSDLPIMAPEVRGAVERSDAIVLLDVGGDPVGARALGSIADVVSVADHDLLLVLNRYRPFMESTERVLAQIAQIEGAATMKVTGIISNTNLLEETTKGDVEWGLELAREVSASLSIPIRLLAVPEGLAADFASPGLPPVVAIRRRVLPDFLGGVILAPRERSTSPKEKP